MHGGKDSCEVNIKAVKSEPDFMGISTAPKWYNNDVPQPKNSNNLRRQDSEENMSSSALTPVQSITSVLDRDRFQADDSSLCSTSPICAAPICRQFWKAGSYNDALAPKPSYQSSSGHLHIHPKFLHSNATSHKWAFGAIAELIDNAVDEIQNEATFVSIDKTTNPRDGSSALLIQDDGGGMDPEAMRRCLSFGFSDKNSTSAIGQYGNGFKTSTMRLGADVIVFTRNLKDRKWTQSIGLLSYTFLTQGGHDRIIVPMVSYEYNLSTSTFESLHNSSTNLSVMLQWSPYSTEEELLKQLENIGAHGTKVIIYNLWFDDGGIPELDFESDPEDIRLSGVAKTNVKDSSRLAISERHVGNRLRYSLRAYLSILYLRLPETFYITLRGKVVEYYNIAADLKHPELVVYKPQSGGTINTAIGFLKEAPEVNVHGFNVYHKNRLILPFWRVVSFCDSRGRGVVGVLEANFIQPTHNKQDFEKTSVFQKLENRLKEMTWEYWDYHCGLIGYLPKKKLPAKGSSNYSYHHLPFQPPVLRKNNPSGSTRAAPAGALNYKVAFPPINKNMQEGILNQHSVVSNPKRRQQEHYKEEPEPKRRQQDHYREPELKRRQHDQSKEPEMDKMQNVTGSSMQIEPVIFPIQREDPETASVMEENRRLRSQLSEFEKTEEELNQKANKLKAELGEAQREYARLLIEARQLQKPKVEKNVPTC